MQKPNGAGSKHPLDDRYHDLFSTSDLKKDLNRKTVRGGATAMGAQLASSILRIGSMAVLARLLLPEDFGLLAMVVALTVIAERFKDLGLSDATVQTRQITHFQVSSLFWINMAVCMGITLLLAFLSKTIAWFYDEPRLTAVSLVIASTFLFSGLVIQHQALLQRQFRFGTLALIQLSSIMLSLVVAIALAYYGFGYWALVAREFSRAVFVVLGTWLVCPWRPSLPRREVGLAHLLSFGRNVTGFNLVYFFSRSFDRILIGKLHGPYWVGLYANAYKLLAMPMSQIQYPVNAVALPALSALQAEPSEFRAYYEKMLHLLMFFSMPFVVFVAVFADVIIGLLLGPQWMKAVPIFQVLAVGAFVEPIAHSVGPAMVACGRTKEYFRLGLMNAILLLGCLTVGSSWGVIGIAIGQSGAVYLAVVLSAAYGLRHTPISIVPLLRRLAANFCCALLMGLVLYCVRYVVGWFLAPQWLALFAIGGVLTYLGLWLLFPGGRKMLLDYWNYARHAVSHRKR